jgi:transposase
MTISLKYNQFIRIWLYIKHCKLSRSKQLDLIKYFISGLTARTADDLMGIHYNKAIRLRAKIVLKQQHRRKPFCVNIELDESYFGGVRKGKRERTAAGKVPVFGLLKRGGKVYTQIITDAKYDTLMPIIGRKIKPDSIVLTDC